MTAIKNPVILIPARLASTRFPGKPLAEIGGEAMIVHVWRRAIEAEFGPVFVASAGAASPGLPQSWPGIPGQGKSCTPSRV